MKPRHSASTQQLGFDELLQVAAHDNAARRLDRRTAHLPGGMDEAVPFFRGLIDKHHAAMLAADVAEVLRLRKEAHLLAVKLNGGNAGMCAHPDAPAYVLARATQAEPGILPLWGQMAVFEVAVAGAAVRIEMDGIFGIGGSSCFWLGFSAHAVDWQRPFISETGYRSFLGVCADPVPGLTPAAYVEQCVMAHVRRELRGRLVTIEPRYRERPAAA
ncbi:MAG TPA: hypothetical protein PKA13_26375 [Geminicoccaceae bacterium]|nr:hypothetical protein [Geminicoccus sp.]HMU53325.1 hypothetical protein [Geminicoccaceae bacterium]